MTALSWHELVQPPAEGSDAAVQETHLPHWLPDVPEHTAKPGPANPKSKAKYAEEPGPGNRTERRKVLRKFGVVGRCHTLLQFPRQRSAIKAKLAGLPRPDVQDRNIRRLARTP